jgi:hypothetical protein
MGNHLSAIAHGRGLQLWALEHYGLESDLLLKRQTTIGNQDNPKAKSSSQILQQCFPTISHWEFDGVSTPQLERWKEQQQEIVDFATRRRMNLVNGRPMKGILYRDPQPIIARDMDEGLQVFQQQVLASKTDHRPPTGSSTAKLSLPYLYSDSLDNILLMDRYLDHYRQLFTLNPSCCAARPLSDESVFHFRNFATELPHQSHGLEDATPNQTAHALFGHLQVGDKVAITSRFDNALVQTQVHALQARGLEVRVVTGQSGIQDFCFLRQAQKELVGNVQSTFVLWAALLGTSRNVRLYTLDSPDLRQRYGPTVKDRFQYEWTHSDLKGRVKLELLPWEPQ